MVTLSIILQILILCIGLYLAFLKSYFSEKGKQLAIKEDIEEITDKVEKIKSDFQRENDDIKAKVQHLLTLQQSHRTEERNAIIDFYRKYNDWLYSLIEINYGAFNRGNITNLIETRHLIDKHYRITNVAQSMVKLLVKDGEIIKLSNELIIKILEFKNWMDLKLLKLQQNLESHDSLTYRFLELIKDFEKNQEAANELAEKEKTIISQYELLKKDFYDNRNSEYSKILSTDNAFTENVKGYLTNE